jgi:hypothetical protein
MLALSAVEGLLVQPGIAGGKGDGHGSDDEEAVSAAGGAGRLSPALESHACGALST